MSYYPARTAARPRGGIGLLGIVYLVVGEDKAEVARRAFVDDPGPKIPAGLIRGRRTIAILDRPAARLLRV